MRTQRSLPSHRLPQGFLAARVDDIDMRVEQLRERHEVMDAFGLDQGRAALMMPFGAGLAFGEQHLLERQDEIRILAVRGGNDA